MGKSYDAFKRLGKVLEGKNAALQNKSREKGTAGEKSRCQIAQEDSQDGAKKSSQQDESRVKEAQGKDKEVSKEAEGQKGRNEEDKEKGSKETEEGDCQGEEEDHQREEKIAQGASRRPG